MKDFDNDDNDMNDLDKDLTIIFGPASCIFGVFLSLIRTMYRCSQFLQLLMTIGSRTRSFNDDQMHTYLLYPELHIHKFLNRSTPIFIPWTLIDINQSPTDRKSVCSPFLLLISCLVREARSLHTSVQLLLPPFSIHSFQKHGFARFDF